MTAKQQDIVLRVFMENTGSVWRAICVDLDIAAQGKTRLETMNLMDEMVTSYLEDAFQSPLEQRRKLLSRKSPLSVRVGWALKIFASSLFANRASGDKVSILSHHHCPA